MDFLALFIFASILGAALVALVIVWTTNRAAHNAVTRHFQASEYILETGNPPPNWLGKRADPMRRLGELIAFFETCRFFEDEFAREQLLSRLAATREEWSGPRICPARDLAI